jgi:2-haloacid dehalogenase
MMMRKIDTVVFDVGNVLIRWDVHNLYRKMFPNDAAISAFLDQTKLLVRNHYGFDKGEDFAAGLADLARQFPHHAKPLAAFDERWAECLNGPINGNVMLLRDLKAAGVPVHAITNFNQTKFREAQTIFPFLEEFDETVVSGIERLIKPEPEIFHVLLARRGLVASQCVFIDDSAENIATAKALGFNTVHYAEGHTDARAAFQSLGLPV